MQYALLTLIGALPSSRVKLIACTIPRGAQMVPPTFYRIARRFVDANKERLHLPLDITKQSPSDGTALRSKSLGSIHSGKTNFDPFMHIKLI